MSDTRQNNQLRLAFSEEGRSEAPKAPGGGSETLTAKRMNESPANHEQLMEEVCERENCLQALKRVKSNKGSAGIDGMTVEELPIYLREHWPAIREQLLSGTYKPQPVKRVEIAVYEYTDVKQAKWPEADFIVGNPPFIGGKDIRAELGDGYVEALRKAYDLVPDSADFVMYWWQRAAELARTGKIRRFGFITTNSLPQVFNRKVVAQNLSAAPSAKLAPLSLIFAIPDHPWLKSALSDGQAATDHAAVRIAMTVGERGEHIGHLYRVKSEGDTSAEGTDVELTEQAGRIFADLRIGSDVAGATPLKSNEDLCCRGVVLHGAGFIVTPEQATSLGLGKTGELEKYIRPYVNGRDLTGRSRNVMVIDLFGMTASEVRKKFPEVYQWVFDHVKSERDQNREPFIRDNWWVFGRPRPELRAPLAGLTRYISTVETAKHRVFVLLDSSILPDNKLVNFALSDALSLGVLSSRIHVSWALASGGHLGVGNDPVYVKTSCFDKFPFPDCSEAAKQTIGEIAERLDAHRKRQQQLHPTLTLTEMYNVLEKLRANEEFTIEDHTIYEMGLIGILREIHDELDEAVFAAYGWSLNLSTEQILANVVALNAERRTEEASGIIRWLRPEFQAPNAPAMQQTLGGLVPIEAPAATRRKQPWPATLTDQFRVIKDALRATPFQTPQQIASGFKPASRTRVQEILQTLTALGQTRQVEDRYLL
jgi:hypothetical protein